MSAGGSIPTAMPTATSTIGGESAIRRVTWGRTIASSSDSPRTK